MGQILAASQPLLPPQTAHSETGFHPNSPPLMCQAGPCSKQVCSQELCWYKQCKHMTQGYACTSTGLVALAPVLSLCKQ